MAGRDTPLIRPMRRRAEAIVAPVLPAEIMADALPSRTASAARTSDESFIRRTLDPGSALIGITSEAGITSRSPRMGSRSEEHTSELQSLMRISYAVFCLNKKKTNKVQELIRNTY